MLPHTLQRERMSVSISLTENGETVIPYVFLNFRKSCQLIIFILNFSRQKN